MITLPRSKTDQEGDGMRRAIPYSSSMACAASALKHWVNISGITSGTLFTAINRWDQLGDKPLNPGSINQILKSLGRESGFDFIPLLSSHSFRRGLSTSAAREKVDFELIKKQGGWKNDASVWEYIDEGQQFTDNASLPLMDKMDALLK